MDYTLFCSVLRSLLHINIDTVTLEENYLKQFEEKYCYHPALQPIFQAEEMRRLISNIEPDIIYEFRDRLGVCSLFFLLEGAPVLLGPFVRKEFDLEQTRRVMLSVGLSGSHAESIRLFYSNYPLCSVTRAIDSITACIQAFCPNAPMFKLARLDDYSETKKIPKQNYEENIDYDNLYRRYELENQFLHAIEKGDTENVLIAYERMESTGVRDKRFVTAIYQDANVSLAILRSLARKAAERGGASVIEVNEITQRAVQRMQAEMSVQSKLKITTNMILELTEAVERAHNRMAKYSSSIRRATDTLRHNFSQNLSLEQLSNQVGMSPSHLSRTFSKEVGMSIPQYVASLRCEEAASMLSSTDLPISEISEYVGYLDNNYFVKVFKKQYGMTPSEYRAGKKKE